MKKNTVYTILSMALLLMLFASWAAFSGSNNVSDIKAEFVQEHDTSVSQARAELPLFIRQLKDGDLQQREEAAQRLGQSEDSRSIIPLTEAILTDTSSDVRNTAISSILYLAYRADAIPQFDEYLKNNIIPALRKAIENDASKRSAAIALYKLGEKNTAFPILESLVESGDASILNIFYYIPELSTRKILVNVALLDKLSDPSAKVLKLVDKDSYKFLLNALNHSNNAVVKVKAAEMIYEYNIIGREYLIVPLREVIVNSKDKDSRIKALSLLYKIDTPESNQILEEATNIQDMKDYALHYLDYSKKRSEKSQKTQERGN